MGFLYSQLFVTPPVPQSSFHGQTVVVTGANIGLGLEAARHFARLGVERLILAVRDLKKGKAAADSIAASTCFDRQKVEVWRLDLSSYASVKEFASRLDKLPRLDVLVENAAILTSAFNMMEDNESTITVNLVNTVFLATKALPKLRESAKIHGKEGRLIFVGSETYLFASFEERKAADLFEALNAEASANMKDRYYVSKLLLLMATRELAAANPVSAESPVVISILTPGFCQSSVFRDQTWSATIQNVMSNVIGRTTEVGSRTIVDAALPRHGSEIHGKFLWDCEIAEPTGYITSREGEKVQKRLWRDLSAKLVAIDQRTYDTVMVG